MKKIVQFLKEVVIELKKVSWSSRKEVIGATIIVIILVSLISIYIGIVDFFLTWIIRIFLR